MWLQAVENVAMAGVHDGCIWRAVANVLADLAAGCRVGRDIIIGLRIEIQGYILMTLPCLFKLKRELLQNNFLANKLPD